MSGSRWRRRRGRQTMVSRRGSAFEVAAARPEIGTAATIIIQQYRAGCKTTMRAQLRGCRVPTAALTGYFSLHGQGERGHTNKTLPVYLFSLKYRSMDDMSASSLQPCHVSRVRWGRSAAICCMRWARVGLFPALHVLFDIIPPQAAVSFL